MNIFVYFVTSLLLATTIVGNIGSRASPVNTMNHAASSAGASASSGSSSSTNTGGSGYGLSGAGALQTGSQAPFDYGNLLAGAYARFTIDPSFTGTIAAHASLTFDGSLQAVQASQGNAAAIAQANTAAMIQANTAALAGGYGFPGGFQALAFPGFQFPQFPNVPFPDMGVASIGIPAGGVGAGASAAIGGGNVHQAAFLTPENPASPNVNVGNRYGAVAASAPAGDGTYGVFTSSSSSSMNIDGKETVHRQATTTVNDNGQVSTYTVRD